MNLTEFWAKFGQQFETLPERLGGHIGLSLAALVVGVLISIPLGIFISSRPKAEGFFVTIASIIQTIPSLALLALMVFAFGKIGWVPAWLALILYSILPMLRSTVTGMQGIEPAYLEAAKGIGMDDQQTLFSVQLPLALPSIVSGIRTASVWVVGAATLAQPVGATSLGNYIFVGLQTWNIVAIFFGCLFSALLALAFDQLLRGLEIAASKRNIALASFIGALIVALAMSPFVLKAVGAGERSSRLASGGSLNIGSDKFDTPIVVASKNFSESYILMQIIRAKLEEQGLPVETKDGMGSTIVFNALCDGDVDCYVDYTGTIWANHMKRKDTVTPIEMVVDVATFLRGEHGVVSLGSLGFSNDYVFMMRPEDASRLQINTLDDLAKHAKQLKVAADIEFFGRPEWASVRDAYGIEFQEKLTMEPTLMYGAIENKNVDVIVAFRTDGRTINLSVIDDPKSALPPYDGLLLVSQRLARSHKAMKALRPLVQSISSEKMREANAMVDVDEQPIKETANWLLQWISR